MTTTSSRIPTTTNTFHLHRRPLQQNPHHHGHGQRQRQLQHNNNHCCHYYYFVSSTKRRRTIIVIVAVFLVLFLIISSFTYNKTKNININNIESTTTTKSTTTMETSNFFPHERWYNNETSSIIKKKNIIFIKLPKVGGSTFSGILRRVGETPQYNLTGTRSSGDYIKEEPGLWAAHTPVGSSFDQLKHTMIDKLKLPSILITIIRLPEERALSAFYHKVTHGQINSQSDDTIINFLSNIRADLMLKEISTQSDFNTKSPKQIIIRNNYDFIGLTERFDESIVVLKHLLNVSSLEDVLYLSSKNSTFDKYRIQSKPYIKQSKKVRNYIDTTFKRRHSRDYHLYKYVNETLDLYWIDSIIGRDVFDNELRIFRQMLQTANTQCYNNTLNNETKTKNKNKNDCYWEDNGCGIQCLNQIKLIDYISL